MLDGRDDTLRESRDNRCQWVGERLLKQLSQPTGCRGEGTRSLE